MADDDQADPAPEALVTTPVAAKTLGISARTLERYVTQNLVRPEVTLPSGQYRWPSLRARRRDARGPVITHGVALPGVGPRPDA